MPLWKEKRNEITWGKPTNNITNERDFCPGDIMKPNKTTATIRIKNVIRGFPTHTHTQKRDNNLPCPIKWWNQLPDFPLPYANPNPSVPIVIAVNKAALNCSYESYSGRSTWLKQVWLCGSRVLWPKSRTIVNLVVPVIVSKYFSDEVDVPCIPSSSLNPLSGTLEVPVANWRSFALSSLSNDRTARQNHWICGDDTS